MRAIPSVLHLFYANVLVVSLLAANVAFSESVPDGNTVDTLNAAPTPVLNKRYLKSHADITTSNHIYDFEERVNPSGLTASLESASLTVVDQVKTWWWQVWNKSPDDLFKSYRLHKNMDNLFQSPQFVKWVNEVEKIAPKKNKKAIDLIFKVLSDHYKDDALLVETLLTAPEIGNRESTAAKLLHAQHESWKSTGKSPKDVFGLLKLDQKSCDMLFKSPVFPVWASYVMEKTLRSEEASIKAMYEILFAKYEDATLTRALAAEVKDNGMKDIALKLLDVQINNWKNAGKLPKDVFELLELDQVEPDKLFESAVFPKWVTYAEIYSRPEKNPFKEMYDALLKVYKKDTALVEILDAGVKGNGMKDTALKLLDVQINNWKNDGKSTKNVFGLLKLNQVEPDKLFESAVFPKWVSFVEEKSLGSNEAATEVMFENLLALYKKEATVTRALAAGVKVNGMQDTALKLHDVQLNIWKNALIPADIVFTRLGVTSKTDDLLLLRWLDYAKDLKTRHSKVIEILKKNYPTDLEVAKELDRVIEKATGELKEWMKALRLEVFG